MGWKFQIILHDKTRQPSLHSRSHGQDNDHKLRCHYGRLDKSIIECCSDYWAIRSGDAMGRFSKWNEYWCVVIGNLRRYSFERTVIISSTSSLLFFYLAFCVFIPCTCIFFPSHCMFQIKFVFNFVSYPFSFFLTSFPLLELLSIFILSAC